jgi:hypothetical protein
MKLISTLLLLILSAAAAFGEPPRWGRGTYLFIDDHWVESLDNITRTLNRPVRHSGNPVLRADQPWEDGMVVLQPGTVIYDGQESIFKMWYEVPTNDRKRNPSTYLCYATSKDGVKWEKPNLGIVEFRGSKENNIVLAAVQHDGNWFGHSVIKDDAASDPSRRYKLMFWDQTPPEGDYGFFVAFSPDGIRWTRHSNTAVAPIWRSGDTGSVTWSPQQQQFILFQKSPITPVRKVARMTSKDFIHWEGGQVVLEPDQLDQPDTEFYGMSAFPYADRYIGLIWVFHTYNQQMDIQLASSFDSVNWHRAVHRRIFLPLGYQRNDYAGTGFDSEMIFPASNVVKSGDRLLIYYSGFNRTHNFFNNQSGIGLTTLRADGFVSLDAANVPATVVTKPFVLDGDKLLVNLEEVHRKASSPGLRAEIQDQNGSPVKGFELAGSNITAPGVRSALTWRDGSNIAQLKGRQIRLRLVLENSKLYAVHVE